MKTVWVKIENMDGSVCVDVDGNPESRLLTGTYKTERKVCLSGGRIKRKRVLISSLAAFLFCYEDVRRTKEP